MKPTPSVPGFRDTFRQYITRWLQNRPGSNVGYRMLWAMIAPLDKAMQTVVEGARAAFPGLGTPTALPLIGQSRGRLQGEAESDEHFAERVIPWLDDWTQDDRFASEMMARDIQNYLANTPAVTVVDRAGHWMQLSASGVATQTIAPWNWDGTSNPERAGIWGDLWIIVYPCEWTEAPTIAAGAAQPVTDGLGWGHQVDRTAVDAILSLVAQWKGAHTTIRAIVWSYDPTLCLPNGSNNPDGNWGASSKYTRGPPSTRIPARSANARYWTPTAL